MLMSRSAPATCANVVVVRGGEGERVVRVGLPSVAMAGMNVRDGDVATPVDVRVRDADFSFSSYMLCATGV